MRFAMLQRVCHAILRLQNVRCAATAPIFHNSDQWPTSLLQQARADTCLYEEFINEREEQHIYDEVQSRLKRMRYETAHWDDAIHNYRETERTKWSPESQTVIDRVRAIAFDSTAEHIGRVHVLDLHKEGHIKPHIDSVRYCGEVIAGISLLSSAVMRFVHEKQKQCIVDLLLRRRSLYVIRGVMRYEFTHEVLADNESYFNGVHIPRERRISIICRDEPRRQKTTQKLFAQTGELRESSTCNE